jgi:hypothetical protein
MARLFFSAMMFLCASVVFAEGMKESDIPDLDNPIKLPEELIGEFNIYFDLGTTEHIEIFPSNKFIYFYTSGDYSKFRMGYVSIEKKQTYLLEYKTIKEKFVFYKKYEIRNINANSFEIDKSFILLSKIIIATRKPEIQIEQKAQSLSAQFRVSRITERLNDATNMLLHDYLFDANSKSRSPYDGKYGLIILDIENGIVEIAESIPNYIIFLNGGITDKVGEKYIISFTNGPGINLVENQKAELTIMNDEAVLEFSYRASKIKDPKYPSFTNDDIITRTVYLYRLKRSNKEK